MNLKELELALRDALRSMPAWKRAKKWASMERRLARAVDAPTKRAAGKRTDAWKDLERQAAEVMGGQRVSRGEDFSKSDVDARIPDFPWLKVDAKYRNSHSHHALLAEIRRKYCGEGDWPVLVTKHKGQAGCHVTLDLELFGHFLNALRALGLKAEAARKIADGVTIEAMGVDT